MILCVGRGQIAGTPIFEITVSFNSLDTAISTNNKLVDLAKMLLTSRYMSVIFN